MLINRIEGATRVLGKSQGYLGLPIMDTAMQDGTPAMLSSWQPSPEEAKAIAAGAPIILSVIGVAHPPVMLTVGPVPDVTAI